MEKAGFNGILKGEMGNWSVIRDRLIGSRHERWDEADLFLERASNASALSFYHSVPVDSTILFNEQKVNSETCA